MFSQRSTFHGATVIYIDLSTAENLFRRAGRFRIDVLLQILSEWSHSVKNWKTTVTGSRRLIINPQCGGIYDFVMREKCIFFKLIIKLTYWYYQITNPQWKGNRDFAMREIYIYFLIIKGVGYSRSFIYFVNLTEMKSSVWTTCMQN